MNRRVGKRNQKTTRKCHEIKRNSTLTSKISLENVKEIGISTAIRNHWCNLWKEVLNPLPHMGGASKLYLLASCWIYNFSAYYIISMINFFCKILQHPQINPGSGPGVYFTHVNKSVIRMGNLSRTIKKMYDSKTKFKIVLIDAIFSFQTTGKKNTSVTKI